MRNEVIWIGIIICSISIVIYLVKNNSIDIINLCKKIIRSKYIVVVNCVIVIILLINIYNSYEDVKSSINSYKFNNKIKKEYEIYDLKRYEENQFYKSIINLKYENQTYNNPYVLDGFSYVYGSWDSGFVIEDENSNQFVWVPCINIDNSNIPKLQKNYFSAIELISKDYCYDIEYKEFLKSALENGGFYISRYEIGNEQDKPVSKKDVKIWNNIKQEDAINISHSMYENEKFFSQLINGFAYDTTLTWIYNSNPIILGNYDQNNIIYTGRDYSYNNIYDITDNILELTSEKNYETVITRGMYNEDVFDKYYGLLESNNNRYSILEEVGNNYTGFRVVLFKK